MAGRSQGAIRSGAYRGLKAAQPINSEGKINGRGDGGEARWVGHLADDPAMRLRMRGKLYDLRAVRVDEARELDLVRRRYIEKYDIEDDPAMDGEFGEEAWVFRLDPR
ncbi:MAG: hypothetical protein IIA41_04850 [SAR324 cluster bacterium]|nr:hypothetical protein [SAR324 cluster bacterium]